jgi:uncharacterized membrane protein
VAKKRHSKVARFPGFLTIEFGAAMTLRSPRERIIQTLAFETGGLLLAVPIYVLVTNGSSAEGARLMAALSVAVMVWSPLHNTIFDWADLRLTGRLASNRPQTWRMVHAVSHEVSAVLVTAPILIGLGGFTLGQALMANLGLTLLYTVYAYGFHLIYDQLRPVGRRKPTLTAS